MFFKLNHNRPELELPSAGSPGRWKVAIWQLMEQEVGGRWRWWWQENTEQQDSQRLSLALGMDQRVASEAGNPRPVVFKTVKYRLGDLRSEEAVRQRRRVLEAQVELLNRLDSPLLPEPLDLLEVKNGVDRPFPQGLRENEPVLVLDWLPGQRLDALIRRGAFRFISKDGDGELILDEQGRPKRSEGIDTPRVARIGRRLVSYLELLKEKGVVCFDLNPCHVLLLKNDIPRFLGIGRLCPLLPDGRVDADHPNYLQTSRGYAPPEVNDPGTAGDFPFACKTTPERVGAFALGTILLQMVCGAGELPKEWIHRGTLKYPNPDAETRVRGEFSGEQLHELIARLCADHPGQRLTNLWEIDHALADLARDSDSERSRQTGAVKFYDPVRGFGYVVCDDCQFGEVFIGCVALERSGLAALAEGQRVSFEVRPSRKGGFEASHLQLIKEIPVLVPDPLPRRPKAGPKERGGFWDRLFG